MNTTTSPQFLSLMRYYRVVVLPLMFLVGFPPLILQAQTIVPPGLVSGNWTLANSPYFVQGGITVTQGNTLTIEAGVTVQFDSNAYLRVYGVLTATGQPDQRIVFTSSAVPPAPGNWSGILMRNAGSQPSTLDYIDIAFAMTGLDIESTVGTASPDVTLSHSDIHQNSSSGLRISSVPGASILEEVKIVSNRVYSNSSAGIQLLSVSDGCDGSGNAADIIGNHIFANAAGGISMQAINGSFACIPARHSFVVASIAKNLIHHNAFGITSTTASSDNVLSIAPTIVNNLIVSNASHGLKLFAASGEDLSPTLVNNTIVNNGGAGIQLGNSPDGFLIRNNIVAGNQQGIAAINAFLPTAGQVGYNNVYSNSSGNWSNYPSWFGTLNDTNRNGTQADVELNISVDPQFLDLPAYHIPTNSPMVNAGFAMLMPKDDVDEELRLTLPDIGWDENTPFQFTGRVTTWLDEDDGALGAGTGDSFREVLQATTTIPGADTISFASFLGQGRVVLSNALPRIDQNVNIVGLGASKCGIEASGDFRVFDIASGGTVNLSYVTIAHGVALSSPGGGVRNEGMLTLSGCTVRSNATDYGGGGIYNAGTLLLDNCQIVGNNSSVSSGSDAGGILNVSTLTLVNCLIQANNARGDGGGVFNHATGSLLATNCIFSDNTSANIGGGLLNRGSLSLVGTTMEHNSARGGGAVAAVAGEVTLLGCTLSGNSATVGQGGAIRLGFIFYRGQGSLINCTVSGNQASDQGGGVAIGGLAGCRIINSTITANSSSREGGGLLAYGNAMLTNTVVAGNFGLSNSPAEILHAGGTLSTDYVYVGGNPMLGPLLDHGGITRTHAPLPGSPLINAGDPVFSPPPATDQRGMARIQEGRIDIGAVETAGADIDSDLVPNDWELMFDLNPNDPLDAFADNDSDGMTSRAEYIAGTIPTNAISAFRILSITNGPPVSLTYQSALGRRYDLLSSEDLDSGIWSAVPGQSDVLGTGGMDNLIDSPATASRYYRIRVRLQ